MLERHGEDVITRNAYGARCLNSPDALFADVDFDLRPLLFPAIVALALLSVIAGVTQSSWRFGAGLLLASLLVAALLARLLHRVVVASFGDPETRARRRLAQFLRLHLVAAIIGRDKAKSAQ